MRFLTFTTFAAALCSAAYAQSFTNGDFSSGALTGWTITNTAVGTTTAQDVQSIDIDGAGPLAASNAAHFQVGSSFAGNGQQGISIVQALNLVAGTAYTISYNYAVKSTDVVGSSNGDGGNFSLLINGTAKTSASVGVINGGQTLTGTLSTIFTPTTTGSYQVGASITRGFVANSTINQYADNFSSVAAVPEPTTMALFGVGLTAMLRKRRKK